ncbi:hypothetical protein HH308_20700 [Gordonia sp. TBRC 11910]|uniref:Uncharacterized protein n=1 Tax=Gordonia asplenii TaxID=2725283 RepID=A0A848KZ23_9ACTN|nr:hypothetical protein [Gordonia asplenii]NMO03639.1 hypothetical protein [Gordonia asplenii]
MSLGMSAVVAGVFGLLAVVLLLAFRSRTVVGHGAAIHLGAWLGAAAFFLAYIGPTAGSLQLEWSVQWLVLDDMTEYAVGHGIAYGLLLLAWLAGHRTSLGMIVLAPVGGVLCGVVYAYAWMFSSGLDFALRQALEPALACLILVAVSWLAVGIEHATAPRTPAAPVGW